MHLAKSLFQAKSLKIDVIDRLNIIFPSPTQVKHYQKVKGLIGLMC